MGFLVSLAETAGEHQLPTIEGQQKKIRLECSPEVLPNLSVYMDRDGSVGATDPQRRHNSWNTVDTIWEIKA